MSTEYACCPKINEELQLSQISFYVVVIFSKSRTSSTSPSPQLSTCVRPDPELPAPTDDLCHFRVVSGCSSWMRLCTLRAALPLGRELLQMLLACAPLPDAVTCDAATGVTPGRGAGDATLAGREKCAKNIIVGLAYDSPSLRWLPSMVSTSIEVTPPALPDRKSLNYLTSHRHRSARFQLLSSRQWNEHDAALILHELQPGSQSQYIGHETTL